VSDLQTPNAPSDGSGDVASGLTRRQQEAVDFRDGNLLVEAVPGSGKTRVIVARCLALLAEGVAPSQILLLTFSRRAVGELRARLARALEPERMPEIRTFHGFAAQLLADAGEGGRSRRLLSEPSERALFERTVELTELASLKDGVVASPLFREAAAARVSELRRAPAEALARLRAVGEGRLNDLLKLEAEQKRLRAQLGVADYDDLVARAVALASTPGSAVANALDGRYHHALVDEFQDTDPLQLELLRCLGAMIFAVGDRAQAIYGFRGAARNALERARQALSMAVFPLADSFRCPANICALARAVQPNSTLQSSTGQTGELVFRRTASPHDEAAFIGESIAAAIAAGTPEREIAVLVRAAEPLAGLVEVDLRARGIAVARRGGENVLDDLTVGAIRAALTALADPTQTECWRALLAHPAFGMAPLTLRRALDTDPPRSVDEACSRLELWNVPARISGGRLAAALRAANVEWLANEPVRAGRAFAAGADLLGFAVANDENAVRHAAAAISSFLAGLGDVRYVRQKLALDDMSSADVFEAFLKNSDAWRIPGEAVDDEPGVRVLTVHAAKGLEFDVVAIAEAVEDRFPQAWRPDPLLRPAELAKARACGVDLGTVSSEHDAEERSLWYVAVTRAKRKLLVTWSETALDGAPQRPSRFVPLEERTREAALKSFRAELRYDDALGLVDPQPPSPARLPRAVRASSMETWLKCRRQFYYGALLSVQSDERGFSAKLGTLVHAAIERFHTGVRNFNDVAENASVAWTAALQDLARALAPSVNDPTRKDAPRFDTTLEREAALRSANRLLARYARNLESSARGSDGGFEVEAVEEKVRFTVDGVTFSGKIDRIDRRRDGALVIVDVKTGRAKTPGMVDGYINLRTALEKGTLRNKALPNGTNPQLPLYRHAKPGTRELEYLYLGVASKRNDFADVAHADRLDSVRDAAALEAIDAVLTETFFTPWKTGAIETLDPTTIARTCMYCDFVRVCPGYLEDEE
jgi:superfamily I DNA/RNA helicase